MKGLWIVLVVGPLLVMGQTSSQEYDKVTFKFTPSTLMSLTSPVWQFGFEYRPKKSFGINTEIGTNLSGLHYGINCLSCSGQQYYHINYKMKEEFRWYMTPGPNPEWYFAQEVFAMSDNYRLRNGYSNQDSLYYQFGRAEYTRLVFGTASKIGVLYNLNKRCRLEMFIGLGVRLHRSNFELWDEKRMEGRPSSDSPFNRASPVNVEMLPHPSIGFKLGYVLWKGIE